MTRKTTVPVTHETSDPRRPALAGWPGFGNLRDEIDRLFDSFGESRGWFGRGLADLVPTPAMLVPAIDLVETNGGYEVAAELPGLEPGDVEVRVADGLLTLSGEKTEAEDEDRKGYHVSERRWGSFRRQVRLPPNIDEAKIEATFSKGVLTVRLPRSASAIAAEKTIEVKAA